MIYDRFNKCCNMISAIFDGAYGWIDEAIAILLLVIIFNFIAKRGLKKLHEYFERTGQVWKDSFVQALYRPLSAYVWFFAFFHTVDLISHRVFEGTFLSDMHVVLSLGLVVSIAWFLLLWKKSIAENVHRQHLKHSGTADSGKIDVMDKILTVVIVFFAILSILEITGQNINTLIAFGGVGGLAIAFASQEMISNFFGGFMIYVTRPFTVGDWINLPQHKVEGYVEEIGWYMTRIRTFEKRPIYIPNSMFSKVIVMTPSRMSHRKFDEIIGIRYSDMPVAREVIQGIKAMLASHPNVDQSLTNLVNLNGFGTYKIDIHISAYLSDISAEGYANTRQDLLFKIYDIINSHGAELPLPTSRNVS